MYAWNQQNIATNSRGTASSWMSASSHTKFIPPESHQKLSSSTFTNSQPTAAQSFSKNFSNNETYRSSSYFHPQTGTSQASSMFQQTYSPNQRLPNQNDSFFYPQHFNASYVPPPRGPPMQFEPSMAFHPQWLGKNLGRNMETAHNDMRYAMYNQRQEGTRNVAIYPHTFPSTTNAHHPPQYNAASQYAMPIYLNQSITITTVQGNSTLSRLLPTEASPFPTPPPESNPSDRFFANSQREARHDQSVPPVSSIHLNEIRASTPNKTLSQYGESCSNISAASRLPTVSHSSGCARHIGSAPQYNQASNVESTDPAMKLRTKLSAMQPSGNSSSPIFHLDSSEESKHDRTYPMLHQIIARAEVPKKKRKPIKKFASTSSYGKKTKVLTKKVHQAPKAQYSIEHKTDDLLETAFNVTSFLKSSISKLKNKTLDEASVPINHNAKEVKPANDNTNQNDIFHDLLRDVNRSLNRTEDDFFASLQGQDNDEVNNLTDVYLTMRNTSFDEDKTNKANAFTMSLPSKDLRRTKNKPSNSSTTKVVSINDALNMGEDEFFASLQGKDDDEVNTLTDAYLTMRNKTNSTEDGLVEVKSQATSIGTQSPYLLHLAGKSDEELESLTYELCKENKLPEPSDWLKKSTQAMPSATEQSMKSLFFMKQLKLSPVVRLKRLGKRQSGITLNIGSLCKKRAKQSSVNPADDLSLCKRISQKDISGIIVLESDKELENFFTSFSNDCTISPEAEPSSSDIYPLPAVSSYHQSSAFDLSPSLNLESKPSSDIENQQSTTSEASSPNVTEEGSVDLLEFLYGEPDGWSQINKMIMDSDKILMEQRKALLNEQKRYVIPQSIAKQCKTKRSLCARMRLPPSSKKLIPDSIYQHRLRLDRIRLVEKRISDIHAADVKRVEEIDMAKTTLNVIKHRPKIKKFVSCYVKLYDVFVTGPDSLFRKLNSFHKKGNTRLCKQPRSPRYACSVCGLKAWFNTIQCLQCASWVHKNCSGLTGSLKNHKFWFTCSVCRAKGNTFP